MPGAENRVVCLCICVCDSNTAEKILLQEHGVLNIITQAMNRIRCILIYSSILCLPFKLEELFFLFLN